MSVVTCYELMFSQHLGNEGNRSALTKKNQNQIRSDFGQQKNSCKKKSKNQAESTITWLKRHCEYQPKGYLTKKWPGRDKNWLSFHRVGLLLTLDNLQETTKQLSTILPGGSVVSYK